jgi:hypothetical protein
MSSDNYFVVRKHPEGGYTYVMGFESDYENNESHVFVNIKVKDSDPIFTDYEDALNAALADYSEYGVVTHPECSSEEMLMRAEITD